MKTNWLLPILIFFLSSGILTGQDAQQTALAEQKLSATSKYDFIPGESLMFFDDFTQDNIGDFPALWNTDGSGEIVTTNLFPGRWLKLGVGAAFVPTTKKVFPDNFTVEFDLLPIPGANDEKTIIFGFYIYSALNPNEAVILACAESINNAQNWRYTS